MRTICCLLTLLTTNVISAEMSPEFRRYWYDQGAEMARYELVQSRYGQQRQGDAVLVYVTEPFNRVTQVKSDNPKATDAVPILKVNHRRNFLTGIYPYECMTSVFQPINHVDLPHALKVTTSVQEWCGQVFEQFNRRDDGWYWRLFSYFESEGDRDQDVADAWLEDEMWTLLRLDPTALPSGDVSLIPGALYRRFAHHHAAPQKATISFQDAPAPGHRQLIVRYTTLARTLSITFENKFPHRILNWHETDGAHHTTATRTHLTYGPYWQWNRNQDLQRRSDLGLD